MSYEPITVCRKCGDAFDVYMPPDERICESCLEAESDELPCPDCGKLLCCTNH